MLKIVDKANKQSLGSLEHLSAVAVAKDGRNHQILAQIDATLKHWACVKGQ